MAMAMACNNTRPRKLSLSCRTRTFQALILSTAVFLAASTAVVVGMEPQPPASGGCRHYRFELTHVDANLNLSSDELMRRAYDRSRLRAASLAADTDDSDGRHEGHVSIRDASYLIKFYLDNLRPEDNISAVVDTGSNIIWTTEAECKRSTTRSMLPCCSPKCEQRANCGCRSTYRRSELKAEAEKCTYAVKYGDNDKYRTAGVLYEDKLTIVAEASEAVPSSQSFEKKIAIGCSTSATLINKFKDDSIKGVFGLGRGATSLPRQLNFNKFSYCLSSYQKPKLPSYLLLTAAPDMATGAKGGAAVATTGLQPNNEYKTRYFVNLQGISIGGTRLPVSMQSGGNMFVDTGASFTLLEGTVFAKLVNALDRVMEDKYVKEQPGRNDGKICYSPSTTADESSKLPDMVLHFADSADMVLPWDSYLWKASKLCLAINNTNIKGGISVLGNFQMQNIHMLLDTENEKLSFVPADCSNV